MAALFFVAHGIRRATPSVCIIRASDVPAFSDGVNDGAAMTIPSGRANQYTVKETMMKLKMLVTALLATFLGMGAGLAQADDSAAKPKPTRSAAPPATAAPPAAPVVVSQQDKMRQCSKQASGKKGAERKDFMKTCLSKKVKA